MEDTLKLVFRLVYSEIVWSPDRNSGDEVSAMEVQRALGTEHEGDRSSQGRL